MTLREFATMLATPTEDPDANAHASRRPAVPYVSRCGSLLEEFPSLVDDCADEIPFASQALGKRPDAVNLWIGDERSHTTFHRDHYENVYCVVRGVKVFHLLPPCDGRVLGYADAPAARFEQKLVAGENRAGRAPETNGGVGVGHPGVAPRACQREPEGRRGSDRGRGQGGRGLYYPRWYHHAEQRWTSGPTRRRRQLLYDMSSTTVTRVRAIRAGGARAVRRRETLRVRWAT